MRFLEHALKFLWHEGFPKTDARALLRNLELAAVVTPFERERVKAADERPDVVNPACFPVQKNTLPVPLFHSVTVRLDA